jgi:glycosyltransferase involved in cell wall biosynthesis
MFSLVIPLYRSEPNLPRLFAELSQLAAQVPMRFEVVFVNDGSPDRCAEILAAQAPQLPFECQVLQLSRNFGAFAAIAAGLRHCRGDYMAVLAADLQEPPSLALEFLRILAANEADVVFGTRAERADPLLTTLTADLFWWTYRRFVNPEIPPGGIDVFGCNRQVRDHLGTLNEADTNLIALLFWLGFRRRFVTYSRHARQEGISAWTFAKKLRYSLDSIFDFTDLPVRVLLLIGLLGTAGAIALSTVVLTARLMGAITVPGYTPVILAIFLFGGLTTLGLGIVAQYLWLTLQNARQRPSFIVQERVLHERQAQASRRQGS